jgi:hypothetical protein
MYLTFVDTDGSNGTVSTDWAVEYDGRFTDRIETVVSDREDGEKATSSDLQDFSIVLFEEAFLTEIRFVENTHHQHERSREISTARREFQQTS